MSKLTIVGGGLSGLVAAITAAEKAVDLLRSQSGRRGAAPAGQAFETR